MPVTPQGGVIDPSDGDASNQLDCVICHGITYNGGGKDGNREVLVDDNGNRYWSHASLEDAKTVGGKVTAEACKRCHVNTGGKVFSPDGSLVKAYKYGTDYVAEPYEFTYDTGDGTEETATIDNDVHAAFGLTCADCHVIPDPNDPNETAHKFQYGQHNVSWAHDEVPDNFNCNSECHFGDELPSPKIEIPHPENPHSRSIYKDVLNSHTEYIACQTCHIRHTGGLMFRDLTAPISSESDQHFYSFDDRVQYGVEPEYRWFNGNSGGWEAVLEGPCPIGPQGSKRGNRSGDGSKITPFKRYQALVWFDMLVLQPVPYILEDFFVDGDLVTAANKGMEQSGWIPEGTTYNFQLRNMLGLVFKFPMICPLKVDHGIQTGENALGYATETDVTGCNSCHSQDSSFWKYLGYTPLEKMQLKKPHTQ